jgi:hypothetical protein
VQATTVTMSFHNEPIVITTKEPKPIRKGIEVTIISYILPLPIKLVEAHVVTIYT